jgi:hypothetical protein
VAEYPHRDDIFLYKNTESLFAHNFYLEAKALLSKICLELVPDYVHQMNQQEILAVYQAILPHKQVTFWQSVVKMLQQEFIAKSFVKERFYRPEGETLMGAHALLDEPTSATQHLQHLVGATTLEKNFRLALLGNLDAEKNLWDFSHPLK